MIFKPIPDRTRWEGILAVGWIVLLNGLLLAWAMNRPTDWLKFTLALVVLFSLPVVGYVLYRTWAAFSLEYWVDRNALTIRWANVRHIVPISSIQRIIDGGVAEISRPRWYHWPAPGLRRGRAAELPNLVLCATRPLPACLLLDTGDAVYVVSPEWRARFIEQLQESYQLGPALSLTVAEKRTAFARQGLGDHWVGFALLGIGMLGVLALFGLLMVQFPSLPNLLPFRYNMEGSPEAVRDKSALFIIPAIGLLTWLVNAFWGMWMMVRKQPTGAYMLWGGAIVVQVFSLLALNSLLP